MDLKDQYKLHLLNILDSSMYMFHWAERYNHFYIDIVQINFFIFVYYILYSQFILGLNKFYNQDGKQYTGC